MDTVIFNDCFGRALFFDYAWQEVTAQSLNDAWFGWPDVIHPNHQSSVFEQWITGHSRRETVNITCDLAVGRKVRAIAQPVYIGDFYIGHVGLVSDRANAPRPDQLAAYLKKRNLLPGTHQPGEFRNLLGNGSEEIDSPIARERADTIMWEIHRPATGNGVKEPHFQSKANGRKRAKAEQPDASVPVLLVSGAHVREVHRCPNLAAAEKYVSEFNRREAILPTGYIAVVHPAYLLMGQNGAN